jgi:predicted nucleic acid-binding protein
VIVADTSAVLALLDADDRHHVAMRELWEADPDAWILPWAILPEVDYMVRRHLGHETAALFLKDVQAVRFIVEHSQPLDIARAAALDAKYQSLQLGLVDGVVAAVAERLRAEAIATLDVRHFGAIAHAGAKKIYPRDL